MKPELKKNLSSQHDDQYTARDTDHFSALVSQCQQQTSLLSVQENKVENDSSQQFEYTQDDNAAFDKLMRMESKSHRNTEDENKTVQHFSKAKTRDGYTNTDYELFTELMSFQSNNTAYSELRKQESADHRECTYSDQDQDNFDRLNPPGDVQDANKSSPTVVALDILPDNNDRDVGVVKIIEYDKLKSERSSSKNRPNENIKIRFFD